MYPRLADGAVVRDRECTFIQPHDRVAISPANEDYALTKDLAKLLGRVDGRTTAQLLGTTFGDDVFNVLENLESANIIVLSNHPSENIRHNRQFIARSGLIASCRSAIWHLTRRCNLSCAHCYYLYQKEEKEDFSLEEIAQVVRNLADLGVEYVTLTGGEVLTNERTFWKAVDELTTHCLPFGINTNATRRIEQLAERLHCSLYVRTVQSSVDGPPELHDRIRGKPGSCDKTLAGIQHLASHGLFTRVVSMLTDHWMEPTEVIALARRLSDAGVRDWLIELPNTTGRWKQGPDMKLRDRLFAAASALYEYLETQQHGFKRAGISQVFEWPLTDSVRKQLSDPACYHDLGLLSFGPEGVSFCTMFREQFGPAWKDMQDPTLPLGPVWDRIAQARIDHRIASNPACSNCELFDWCQGGCPGGYENPRDFSGCDFHSRLLAIVKKKLFADRVLPAAFAPVPM